MALLLSGCLPTGPAAPEAELSNNEALWELRRPDTYEFIFKRSCECPPELTIPMKVTVHEDLIRSVIIASTGAPVRPGWHGVLRIDEMFAEIRIALEGSAHRVEVEYDSEYGYPKSVFVDRHPQMVDEELHITARDLRVIY